MQDKESYQKLIQKYKLVMSACVKKLVNITNR